MNTRQRMFIHHFLGESQGNATDAARRAGYSDAAREGHRLLRIPEIHQAIDAKMDEVALTTAEIQARLSEIALADVTALLKVGPDGEPATDSEGNVQLDLARAFQAGSLGVVKRLSPGRNGGWSVELHDSLRALELLARCRGMLNDRLRLESAHLDLDKLTDEELEALARGPRPKRLGGVG